MDNVYLAARYNRRDEVMTYADDLRGLGYRVLSTWLDTTDTQEANIWKVEGHAREAAREDLTQISRSQMFIIFTESPNEAHPGGGRHVELGYALCTHLYQRTLGQRPTRILAVGPRQTVFHSLDVIERFETWTDALAQLRSEV